MESPGAAIVTGGAKRIGRAIALALAKKGYHIALHYRSSRREAELLVQEIRDWKVQCELFACDFLDMESVRTLVPRVCGRFPETNLLVNNASIFERGRMMQTEEELFDRHFQINFKTPFFLSRDFARRCQKGLIINLLDTKVSRTLIEYFAYTLSKKALHDLTRMAAKELAPKIRVNGVCPGLILPPPGEGESYLEEREQTIPLQTRGTEDQIAAAVEFLIDHSFITGDCLYIDGGEHLKS